MFKYLKISEDVSPLLKYNGCYQILSNETVVIPPKEQKKIKSGLKFELPVEYFANVYGSTSEIKVLAGVVDSDFRGEISVLLFNATEKPITIKKGDVASKLRFVRLSDNPVVEVFS